MRRCGTAKVAGLVPTLEINYLNFRGAEFRKSIREKILKITRYLWNGVIKRYFCSVDPILLYSGYSVIQRED